MKYYIPIIMLLFLSILTLTLVLYPTNLPPVKVETSFNFKELMKYSIPIKTNLIIPTGYYSGCHLKIVSKKLWGFNIVEYRGRSKDCSQLKGIVCKHVNSSEKFFIKYIDGEL